MNVHKKVEKQTRVWPQPPRSFTQTARDLNLQGWAQGHSDLIVSREGLVRLLQSTLETVIVDEGWYLETYPDVRSAVEEGSIADAQMHYRTFGYFEGRLPSSVGFNPERYLEQNPDLQEPLGGRGSDAILEHFLRHGYQEGRNY